ncbi:hypothetical protein B5723_07995 [Mammaliicoccus sciuri]|uniref:UvrD-helicase domain-containing protein n=1 Tax=Mammaliicoccus sciuri TaxID=1296 RepID=UPI000A029297|nr:UvrD-helicase domain-containing protein [Mammaliicoccus sciuri]ORI02815.1 hypothetical protein B5723_07995 [Mammaliicoccus sciuri]
MNKRERYLEEISLGILPKGTNFSEEQKNIILQDSTINVVAGPGTGKTTVLTAKCALLLKEIKNSRQGICLVTHTNVAVDEIKEGLRKLGFKELEYPHFIGTIQEFFNSFFAKKAFHKILGDKKFRVLEDEEYKEKFEYYFERYKPKWYNSYFPNVLKKNPILNIYSDKTFEIHSDTKESYKANFNKCVEVLFKKGYVTNKQCLELAKWHIENHKILLKKAISNRFKFVLLDEAQDTNKLQYELLNTLFIDNEISFQRYGDPYQALYNIFEDETEIWLPTSEINLIPKYDISETSRFNENIAKIVRNVCIERYDNFKSLNIVNSFKPHYIIYENEDDLISKYKSLIKLSEQKSESFALSNKKDAILSVRHEELSSIFQSYSKPKVKVRRSESTVKQAYNLFLDMLSKELDLSINETKEKIESILECRELLAISVKILIKGEDLNLIQYYLDTILNKVSNNKKMKVKTLDEVCKNFYSEIASNVSTLHEEKANFYIGTIHSVKGETHRSTMLVLNSQFIDYSNRLSFNISDLLEDYLVGNYKNPYFIENLSKRKETYKALKLAYVALSRPTHLLVIAIPKSIVKSNFLVRLKEFDWVEHKSNSVLAKSNL